MIEWPFYVFIVMIVVAVLVQCWFQPYGDELELD